MSTLSDVLVEELKENIITYSVGGIFYGIYVVVAFTAIFLLLKKGVRQSLARSVLFALNLIMFIGQTGNLVALMMSELKIIDGLGQTLYDPTVAVEHWEVAIVVFSRINYFISDTIVIWRAWVLFDDRLYLRIMLILCGLGSFVGVALDAVLVLKTEFSNDGGETITVLNKIRILMPVMLLVTNVVATLIIAFKVCLYRRTIKTNMGKENRETNVERVLFLLLESGLVYCACWIVSVIALAPNRLSFVGYNVFATMIPNLTAIYPTLVIILVTTQESYSELSINVSHSIQFARAPSDTVSEGSSSLVAVKSSDLESESGRGLHIE